MYYRTVTKQFEWYQVKLVSFYCVSKFSFTSPLCQVERFFGITRLSVVLIYHLPSVQIDPSVVFSTSRSFGPWCGSPWGVWATGSLFQSGSRLRTVLLRNIPENLGQTGNLSKSHTTQVYPSLYFIKIFYRLANYLTSGISPFFL